MQQKKTELEFIIHSEIPFKYLLVGSICCCGGGVDTMSFSLEECFFLSSLFFFLFNFQKEQNCFYFYLALIAGCFLFLIVY